VGVSPPLLDDVEPEPEPEPEPKPVVPAAPPLLEPERDRAPAELGRFSWGRGGGGCCGGGAAVAQTPPALGVAPAVEGRPRAPLALLGLGGLNPAAAAAVCACADGVDAEKKPAREGGCTGRVSVCMGGRAAEADWGRALPPPEDTARGSDVGVCGTQGDGAAGGLAPGPAILTSLPPGAFLVSVAAVDPLTLVRGEAAAEAGPAAGIGSPNFLPKEKGRKTCCSAAGCDPEFPRNAPAEAGRFPVGLTEPGNLMRPGESTCLGDGGTARLVGASPSPPPHGASQLADLLAAEARVTVGASEAELRCEKSSRGARP